MQALVSRSQVSDRQARQALLQVARNEGGLWKHPVTEEVEGSCEAEEGLLLLIDTQISLLFTPLPCQLDRVDLREILFHAEGDVAVALASDLQTVEHHILAVLEPPDLESQLDESVELVCGGLLPRNEQVIHDLRDQQQYLPVRVTLDEQLRKPFYLEDSLLVEPALDRELPDAAGLDEAVCRFQDAPDDPRLRPTLWRPDVDGSGELSNLQVCRFDVESCEGEI